MSSYDHKKVERKWREEWTKLRSYATDSDESKEKYYVLDMFPYPSGAGLHVGHPKGYIASDVIARKKRMEGKRVLHPMGWDAFGLPAENYAIKTGTPPQKTTDESIATFKKQISNLALSYDWDREIGSHRPDYYRWTQWLFTKFFEKGLVYKKKALVNWDPVDQTVLANEQVLPDGTAERSGAVVEKKELEQWFYKITDYADELIDKLDTLDWPESTKTNQRNWIGRSEGAEIDFPLKFENDVKRIILLHGRTGSPSDNFFPWLKEELEKKGYEVEAPILPHTEEPDDAEQADFVEKSCVLDEHTAIVGHSFGGVVAMRLLERGHKVRRVTLVATPYSGVFLDGKERRSVTAACKRGFDFATIRNGAAGFVVLMDPDDKIPATDSEQYAKELNGSLIRGTPNKKHFTDSREPDVMLATTPTIRVFTTRPDTLFGATYLVLAPEHPWVLRALEHGNVLKNNTEVQAYVEQARKKSDIDRLAADKEKTGVKLEGVEAVNPATGEKIPLYVADYVLGHYGTGAIMAVPAHDERDFAFAKKFDLPIRNVVEPISIVTEGVDAVRPGEEFVKREVVDCIVYNPKTEKYLVVRWKNLPWVSFVTGGIETDTPIEGGIREIAEESGYKSVKFIRELGAPVHAKFYHVNKRVNRWARCQGLYFELVNDEHEPLAPEESALHDIDWLTADELDKQLNIPDMRMLWRRYLEDDASYTGEGIVMNSGEFDWMTTQDARKAITAKYGRTKKTYKLRDWLISRQRYWGAPIPIVYDPEGRPHAIPEEHLPWLLPTDVEYLPKGTSPLGSSKELFERTERIFGKGWKPEIDTMDTFACSSWYFFRFADPHNDKEFASKAALKEWLPVDLYIGGAEHTVLHLLYARFFTKALRDMDYLTFDEPFLKLRHQGLIVAEDGRKMSKRYGNVINPDDIVETYGADTLRVYEMFMGPFQDSIAWNTQSMIGARRFLERVCRAAEYVTDDGAADAQKRKAIDQVLHVSIKKIGDDIEGFKFNTAISQLMILLNGIDKEKQIEKGQWNAFLRLLAPFAPHIAEELWALAGNSGLIQQAAWPTYDESLLQADSVTYAIQVDGKMRGSVAVSSDADDAAIESAAAQEVADRLAGADVARVIIVPKRLVNFVLKK